MALIRMRNGSYHSLPAEKARELWFVISGELTGTPDQQKFADRVDRVFLNMHNAPDSYLWAYRDPIEEIDRWQRYPRFRPMRVPFAPTKPYKDN